MALIKFNPTQVEANVIRKGSMYIDMADGSARDALYYACVPATGGTGTYVAYDGERSGMSIHYLPNDSALTNFAGRLAGQTFTNVGAALGWFAAQSDRVVINREYPAIVTSGLMLNLDSSYLPSYPTTGTTWFDTSRNGSTASVDGPTFSPTDGGALVFDGTDDFCLVGGTATLQPSSALTLECTWQKNPSAGRTILSYSTNGSGAAKTYTMEQLPGNTFQCQVVTSSATYQLAYAVPISNTWYTTTMTYDGITLSLYVNGSLYTLLS